MKRRSSPLAAPDGGERIQASNRYWAGALEVVLGIALQSPNLFAPNARYTQFTQKGRRLTVDPVSYARQLRRIRRHHAR